MKHHEFEFCGQSLQARAGGTLWWQSQKVLCVSDLHLGKSERIARRGGALLPPFETKDTLSRLAEEVRHLDPALVICLGDSFDDLASLRGLRQEAKDQIMSLMAGRDWIWIEGNHDAGPIEIGGSHIREIKLSEITFRHIAEEGAKHEISGHYHPKAKIAAKGHGLSRPCFVIDHNRIIMPAFGTYTGGLFSNHEAITSLVDKKALAVLTGNRTIKFPLRN